MTDKYKLLITGKNPDYFISKLIRNKILIYSLEKSNNKIKIIVNKKDYEKILKLKTSYNIKVLNRYGIIKVKYLLEKYKLFLIVSIIGIIINIILSNIIFSIEVKSSNSYIRKIIYNDLKEYGIKKYRFKKSFKQNEIIKKKILKKEPNDIEWLEIESIGTKYIVKVEQRKKNKKEVVCKPRNIIAKKNAMILNITSESGEVVKKKLDYVKKGDVIISGLIHNKEMIVSKKCAIGKVYGETWYKIKLDLPINYYEEKITGNIKKQIDINVFDKTYTLFNNFKTYKRKTTPIIKSKLLPLSINYTKYLETTVKTKKYNIKTIDKEAKEIALEKLQNMLSKEDTILSKKVLKKYEKNSKIEIDVFIKVKEDITDTESIENINIEEENNKKKEQ